MPDVLVRSRRHGLLWGTLAFAAGWAITEYSVTQSVVAGGFPDEVIVTWFFLSAHGVVIPGAEWAGIRGPFHGIQLGTTYPQYAWLRVLPPTLVGLAGLFVGFGVGATDRLRHVIGTSIAPLWAYVPLGVLAYLLSTGPQGFGHRVATVFVLAGAFIVSATLQRRVGDEVPFVGILSLIGLCLVATAVLRGSPASVVAIAPVVIAAGLGGAASALVTVLVRSIPPAVVERARPR